MRRSVQIIGVALALLLGGRTLSSGSSPNLTIYSAVPRTQDAEAGEHEAPLPGGSVPLEEAAISSKGAMVARLIRLGPRDVGSACMADYTETEWEVLEALRGKYPKVMRLSLSVSSCPELSRVRLPSEGATYILLSSSVSKYQISKIADYNGERLREVRALVKAKARSNYRLNRTRDQLDFHP